MSEVRIGYISSVDHANFRCEVTYPDRDNTVTESVPLLYNREYRMPEVEDLVVVLHPGDSPEDAVILGTVCSAKSKPAEGKEQLYRKEYAKTNGEAYDRYDGASKEFTAYTDGKRTVEAKKSIEIKVNGASIKIDESGAVTINTPADIQLTAGGSITMQAATINITGGSGDVVVASKSLVNHKHTGNSGRPTSAPL